MITRTGNRPRMILAALILVLTTGVAFAQYDWGDIVKSSQPVPMDSVGGVGYGEVAEGFASFALDLDSTGLLTIEVLVTDIRQGASYEDDDSMLWLFNAEGFLIAQNDDSPFGGYASLLNGVEIESPGRYYAIVTTLPNEPETRPNGQFMEMRNDGGSNISFELIVEWGIREGDPYGYDDDPYYSDAETEVWFDDFRALSTPIRYTGGELVVGGEVGAGVALYYLTLDESMPVSAEVMAFSDFGDSVLFIFDQDGYLLAENDDGGVGGGSLIHEIYLEDTGAYYVAVVTFGNYPNLDNAGYAEGFPEAGGGEMEFDLVIGPPREDGYGYDDGGYGGEPYPDNGVEANGIQEVARFSQPIPISNGRGIGAGEVGIGYSAFAIEIDNPIYVTIEVVVTEVRQGTSYADSDTMLTLFGRDGDWIAGDDDGGTDGASKIESAWLSTPGTYYAVVTTFPNEPETEYGFLTFIGTHGGSNIAFDLVVRTDFAAQ